MKEGNGSISHSTKNTLALNLVIDRIRESKPVKWLGSNYVSGHYFCRYHFGFLSVLFYNELIWAFLLLDCDCR